MTTLYKYRVYCITDSKYEYVWSEEPPLTCPTNTSDTIDLNSITIVENINSNELKIKEENTPTGGNFSSTTLFLTAPIDVITITEKNFPFPISALSVNFTTISENTGDYIDLIIGKDTTIGTITENLGPAFPWMSRNYIEGETVTFGKDNTYTCILNTNDNEDPTNTTYWKRGLRISVSQTVIDSVNKGFYIKLDDSLNNESEQRVIDVDKTNNYIYIEYNIMNLYAVETPTYIKQSIYFMKDYYIGHPSKHKIGDIKIGSRYIPSNVDIRIEYRNLSSTDTDKLFVAQLNYLY